MVLAHVRRFALVVALVVGSAAEASSPSASGQQPNLRSYFQDSEAIRSGGVKLVPIKTPKGEFKVWTKRFGNNPRIKVLLLHGGPAATHEYLESFEGFLPPEGIELIYYDQLGSAYSDQPKDEDLWTIDRFTDEVEQVRKALGLRPDNFYLLGHSWGGMLAAVRAQVRTESQGARHLQHDDEHSRLQPLRERGPREGDGPSGGEGDP
jgi:proline iminopeptidase